MKERHIEAGIAILIEQAIKLGRGLGRKCAICIKGEPLMSDREWAEKKAKEFIESLE